MISAIDVISALTDQLKEVGKTLKSTERVRIFYAGDFQPMQAFQITPHGDRFLYIRGQLNGTGREIIAPANRCSFMFAVSPRLPDEPPEARVVLGFAKDK